MLSTITWWKTLLTTCSWLGTWYCVYHIVNLMYLNSDIWKSISVYLMWYVTLPSNVYLGVFTLFYKVMGQYCTKHDLVSKIFKMLDNKTRARCIFLTSKSVSIYKWWIQCKFKQMFSLFIGKTLRKFRVVLRCSRKPTESSSLGS